MPIDDRQCHVKRLLTRTGQWPKGAQAGGIERLSDESQASAQLCFRLLDKVLPPDTQHDIRAKRTLRFDAGSDRTLPTGRCQIRTDLHVLRSVQLSVFR